MSNKAEKKAKKEAEQAAKEKAEREAREAKDRAKREAEREAEKKVSDELYEGIVELVTASPIDQDQVRELEEYLRQVQNLRLVLIGGSVEEGAKIVVSVEKPMPLVNLLRKMPLVEQVVGKGKKIQVTLKAKMA